jgi:hypothetical protein
MAVTTTRIQQISLICVPTPDQDRAITLTTANIEATHAQFKALGVDVDAEVSRMGDPVPPMFWFRDPTGHTLMVVEQS